MAGEPDDLLHLTSALGPSYRGFTVEAQWPLKGPLAPRLRLAVQVDNLAEELIKASRFVD